MFEKKSIVKGENKVKTNETKAILSFFNNSLVILYVHQLVVTLNEIAGILETTSPTPNIFDQKNKT